MRLLLQPPILLYSTSTINKPIWRKLQGVTIVVILDSSLINFVCFDSHWKYIMVRVMGSETSGGNCCHFRTCALQNF